MSPNSAIRRTSSACRPGKEIGRCCSTGELDAAILGEPPKDPRLKTVIADPAAAAQAWRAKYGAIQINHMVRSRTRFLEVSSFPDL